MTIDRCRRWSPAVVAFTAYVGAFASLGGEDVGAAEIGVASVQVGAHLAGQYRVGEVMGAGDDEGAQGPNCASIGLAQDE